MFGFFCFFCGGFLNLWLMLSNYRPYLYQALVLLNGSGGAQMFIPSCVGLPLRILTTIRRGQRANELGGFTKVSRIADLRKVTDFPPRLPDIKNSDGDMAVVLRDDTGKHIYVPWKKIHVPWKKYLQPLEKKFRLLWPCGPLVLWSSGCLVLWSCGPLVLWSSGPVVLWSFGPLVLWSSGALVVGPVVLWSCGPLVLSSSGPLVLWSCGPLVLWSSGSLVVGPVVLWSCGPLVLSSSGPLVLWSCRPLVLWSSGPVVLWSSGSLVLWLCSALVLWSQKFYELRANHVACFVNASGGEALRPPPQPPSSQVQVECLNFFSRVLKFFFQGLVGVKPLNLFSRGCKFFSQGLPGTKLRWI